MGYTPNLHLYLPALGEQGYGEALNQNFTTIDVEIAKLSESANPNAYVPTGCQIIGCSANPPEGWLLCDGSEVLRSVYPALFAAIGTTYGTPSSSSKFRLPDKAGRTVVGADPTGTDPDYALGKTGGAESVTLGLEHIPSHNHGGATGSNGNHTHGASSNNTGAHTHQTVATGRIDHETGHIYTPGYNDQAQTGSAGAHAHTITVNEAGAHTHSIAANGGGGAHENRMPFISEFWWIKT